MSHIGSASGSPRPARMTRVSTRNLAALPASLLLLDKLKDIIQRLRRPYPEGIPLVTARHEDKEYSNCFKGSDVVDWVVSHVPDIKKSRRAAITLGEVLVEFGGISSVVPDTPFDDSSTAFYLFVERIQDLPPSLVQNTRAIIGKLMDPNTGIDGTEREFNMRNLFCFLGAKLVNWFVTDLPELNEDRSSAVRFAQLLFERGEILPVDKSHSDVFKQHVYYYFPSQPTRFGKKRGTADLLPRELVESLPGIVFLIRDVKNGFHLKTRMIGFKRYKHCFSGSDACTWLLENLKPLNGNKEAAAMLAQLILERGDFKHVSGQDVPFSAGTNDYYQFSADMKARKATPGKQERRTIKEFNLQVIGKAYLLGGVNKQPEVKTPGTRTRTNTLSRTFSLRRLTTTQSSAIAGLSSVRDSRSLERVPSSRLEKVQDSSSLQKPQLLVDFTDRVVSLSCGKNLISAMTETGEVYMTGSKDLHWSCLGKLQDDALEADFQVNKVRLWESVSKIACGRKFTIAVTESQKIVCWGYNITQNPSTQGSGKDRYTPPVEIPGVAGEAIQASCGAAHAAILTTTGLYTFGSGESNDSVAILGRMGITTIPSLVKIASMGTPAKVTHVACGGNHTIAVISSGRAYGWGLNLKGQLGIGHRRHVIQTPTLIEDLLQVTQVACGDAHTAAITTTGKVYTFGSGEHGELGLGDLAKSSQDVPSLVKRLDTDQIRAISVACGEASTGVTTDKGDAYVWGKGVGKDGSDIGAPRRVDEFRSLHLFVGQLAMGGSQIVALADLQLSKSLEILGSMGSMQSKSFNVTQLRILLESIPINMLPTIQERAHAQLAEEFHEVPLVSIDKSYIEFSFTEGAPVTHARRELTMTNKGNKDILITAGITTELYQNSRYGFSFEPPSFTIPKKQSVHVVVHLTCYKPPVDSLSVLFRFDSSFAVSADQQRATSRPSNTIPLFILAKIICSTNSTVVARKNNKQTAAVLQSYVCNEIITHSLRNPNTTDPSITTFPAAIFLIDISGFTPLTEKLAKLGPAGPEQITKHLNSYFEQLVDAVHRHGGDVLKFAGDALICMIRDVKEQMDLRTLAMRAIQCGIEIQTSLYQYDSNEGFKLTLHVGIGAGTIHSLHIGGVDGEWAFLVAGDPLIQLKTAVENSKTGEVVVSSEVWSFVEESCVGEQRGDDWWVKEIKTGVQVQAAQYEPVPFTDATLLDMLRRYIPRDVQLRLDSFQTSWLAELRKVTVLFIKLTNLAYDKTKKLDVDAIHRALCAMQVVIFRNEGMVRQFLVDDKGTVLIAAFGVPSSHEDDPIRGVITGLDISRQLAAMKITNAIGITTGKAFCGSLGSSSRQEYSIVGDIVNLSARLMGVAEDMGVGILCDEATYNFASSSTKLGFQPLPPVKVKGKANPVVIYTPNANVRRREAKFATSGESPLLPATIIGRQQETDGITAKIGDLLQGKAGVLVVEGVAGMGKSALMRFATEMAREKYIVHYVSSTEATDKTTSYYVWKPIICQILGFEPEKEHSAAQVVEACSQFVASKDSIDYLPLLNKVLPISLPDNDLTRNISPKLAQLEIRRLMKGFVINKTKKSSLMILLEDIQWLDTDSLALLSELAHDTSLSILFLLTGRPNPAGPPPELSKIFCLEHCSCYKLEPITKEQSVHLIKQCLSCTTVSQTVLDLVYSKALGNPMFVEEIVYRLRDAGILQVEGGECIVSGDMSMLDLPGTMQGVIASRIDSLPASPQMVLKVASVIGYSFHSETLCAVLPIEEEKARVDKHLAFLMSLDFILATPKAKYFAFRHEVIQQVAYERLLFEQRRELHKSIAEHFEVFYDQDDVTSYPLLAYHWSKVLEHCLLNNAPVDSSAFQKLMHYLKLTVEQSSPTDAKAWLKMGFDLVTKLPDFPEKEKFQRQLKLQIMGTAFKGGLKDAVNSHERKVNSGHLSAELNFYNGDIPPSPIPSSFLHGAATTFDL